MSVTATAPKGATPNLDERTYLAPDVGGQWVGNLASYPDADVLVAMYVPAPSPPRDPESPPPVGESNWERWMGHETNEQRAARRAKRAVRELARMGQLDHMLTLTHPGQGVHDYDHALTLYREFMHRSSVMKELKGVYLAVPELHPRGHGWHWHVLVRGYRDVARVRRAWTAHLRAQGMAPSGGARELMVNARHLPGRRARQYASKYVGKTFEDAGVEPGRHRYIAGRALRRPPKVSIRALGPRAEALADLLELADRCLESTAYENRHYQEQTHVPYREEWTSADGRVVLVEWPRMQPGGTEPSLAAPTAGTED